MQLNLFQTEKELCYPNPCKNNGTCIKTEESTFVCNCDDTGYTGKTCDILLISTPELSTLTVNSEKIFSFSSSPDTEFTLYLVPDDRKSLKVNPSSMTFSHSHTHYNVTITAIKPGKYTLKYKINDQTLRYQPLPPATILVTNSTAEKSNYFEKYGMKPGILKSGCCSSETLFEIQCPSTSINFKSTCDWTDKGIFSSPGIIFSSNGRFDMPIAIAGAKLKIQKFNVDLLGLNKKEFESDCIICNNTSCNFMPISLNDVQSFLYHESLASTYFYHSSRLIPKWLKFNSISSNRTHDIHSYIVDMVSSDDLNSISECSRLTTITGGLYSVMLYRGLLTVKVHKEYIQSQSNKSLPFCFAVNLCEGASSPLYIAVPDEAQTYFKSMEFIHDLNSKGWIFTINSLTISDSQIDKKFKTPEPIMYWNGIEYFISFRQQSNVVTSVKFNKEFSSDDTVKAKWVFSGNVLWFHDNINKVCIFTSTFCIAQNFQGKKPLLFCRIFLI